MALSARLIWPKIKAASTAVILVRYLVIICFRFCYGCGFCKIGGGTGDVRLKTRFHPGEPAGGAAVRRRAAASRHSRLARAALLGLRVREAGILLRPCAADSAPCRADAVAQAPRAGKGCQAPGALGAWPAAAGTGGFGLRAENPGGSFGVYRAAADDHCGGLADSRRRVSAGGLVPAGFFVAHGPAARPGAERGDPAGADAVYDLCG